MVVQNELPLPKHKENIPLCRTLKLKPLNDQDIIKIDDVVQNCSYQDAYTKYNDAIGGQGRSAPDILFIFENWYKVDYILEDKPYCDYEWSRYYDAPKEKYGNIMAFLDKYKIRDKKYINYVYAAPDQWTLQNVKQYYDCEDDNICSDFLNIPWWEKEGHYFFYWSLLYKESPIEAFILDDTVYERWQDIFKNNEASPDQWPHTLETSSWIISEIQSNKIIVKRGINWEFLEPFKSQWNTINWEKLNTEAINGKIIRKWSFQLETCEIHI